MCVIVLIYMLQGLIGMGDAPQMMMCGCGTEPQRVPGLLFWDDANSCLVRDRIGLYWNVTLWALLSKETCLSTRQQLLDFYLCL
jgi:hypothetical protein